MANAPGPDQFMVVNASVTGTATATRDDVAALRAYKDALVVAMKEEAPVNKDPYAKRRGGLRASIQGSVTGGKGEDVTISFTALDYIRYVVGGTRAHRIPKSGNTILAFRWRTGIAGLHGFHGRGAGGGFLRSTPFGPLLRSSGSNPTLKHVTPLRAAARHSAARGLPRFGGRQIEGPIFNRMGRQTRGPILGNITPTTHKANLVKGSQHFGNIVLSNVHHPGAKPNDFVSRAVDKSADAYDVLVDQLGEDWLDNLTAAFKGEAGE